MQDQDLNKLYLHSINHKAEIQTSKVCGCFYCKRIFEPQNVKEWLKDREWTALCPFCGIDAVIGDASGYSINNDVLDKMNKKFFNKNVYTI